MILCTACNGNGSKQIPGGVSMCRACDGTGIGSTADTERRIAELEAQLAAEKDEKLRLLAQCTKLSFEASEREAAIQEIANICDDGDREVDLWLNNAGFRRDMLADYRLAYKQINEVGRKLEWTETALQVARDALENIECGDGQCNCGYGGCNYACKEYARKALARIEETEVSRG